MRLFRPILLLCLMLSVPASATRPAPAPSLRQVIVKGKPYYATYRVCSKERSACLMKSGSDLRWFQNNSQWQYGSGFYLFGNLKDARKYIECTRNEMANLLVKQPRSPIKARETILEILIPKSRFDAASKAEVKPVADWAIDANHPQHDLHRQLRRDNQILFGRWQEDPHFPAAGYKPMVGTPQIALLETGAHSMLNDAVVRVVGQGLTETRARSVPPRTRQTATAVDRLLPRERRIQAIVDHNRGQHTEFHRLLAGHVDRHQGKAALSYLMNRFPEAKAYFPRESGTWEGFTVKSHTLRAYNVLGSQLRHVDMGGLTARYPEIDVKRTLQLALLLHDLGKPVAIDRARGLIDKTLASGKSLEALERGQLGHHSRDSSTIMSRVMWSLGFNAKEIRLARSLVTCDALGQLEQGKTNMSSARDQLKQHAQRTGLQAGDYFKLQSLLFTSDAGSYRILRRSDFERKPSGQLVPHSMGYQMLQMQLGN